MPAVQAAQPVLPAPHAAFAAAPQTSTSLRVMETKASLVGRADPDRKPAEGLPLYQSPIHAGFPSPAEDYIERSLGPARASGQGQSPWQMRRERTSPRATTEWSEPAKARCG